MDATRDGAELVEWALGIWRDVKADMRDRVEAHRWLADRGLGKPLATVDVQASLVEQQPDEDLSCLSLAQLEQLAALESRRQAILGESATSSTQELVGTPAGDGPADSDCRSLR